MIKVLIVISNDEKKIKVLLKKYKLNYNLITYGKGTASNSLLKYFNLTEVRKTICCSIIPNQIETAFLKELNKKMKLKEIGKGIAFTIKITSSVKYLSNNVKGDNFMENSNSYELIVTIVKEGYAEQVMQVAKKVGATGGTVIEGRSLGSKKTIFMNLAIEPEKDIVLNIVKKDLKRIVMETINELCGVKTEARGVIMALPIDNAIGLQE